MIAMKIICVPFKLISTRYEAISLPENRLWLEELELGLGLWQGTYQ